VDETGDSHRRLAAAGCEVVVARPAASRDELVDLARRADVLLGATFPHGRLDRDLLAASPTLRLVARYTIGVDDIDLETATALGVLVTHAPTEANWGGVAEGAMALMLALLKRVRERDRHVKAGGWREPPFYGTYLGQREDGYPGITVGIVGLGRAGGRVADLLKPWRVRVLACDPYIEAQRFRDCGAEATALEPLLAAADVVTLHCSLTTETRGLIDARRLALVKPTAILINTARGAVVDVPALTAALEAGRLAAAALDVLPEEPPPKDLRLLGLGDRVLLSPHMVAANQGGTLVPAIPWASAATLAALRGEVPEHVYNTPAIATWKQRFASQTLIAR
jgi:phosphoglycerate dehydrogenase-like enzyme